MRHRYYTTDVFTDRIFGGNPLAVFPAAEGLSTEQMQLVAKEFNFSETVFVLPASEVGHARRLRIFSPVEEMPFAGHPTVGAAFVLASMGELKLDGDETRIVLEENIGPVPVTIRTEAGHPTFVQFTSAMIPERGPAPPPLEEIAAALNLEYYDFVLGHQEPRAYSCGIPFLIVPVRDQQALRKARVRPQRWREGIASYWAPNLYVFTTDGEGADIHARMFAPAEGIEEDPATGAGAAALAGYLVRDPRYRDGTASWVICQGVEIGRPSRLVLEADVSGGKIQAVRVGGASVLVCQGEMEIPEL